jgi:hypothetical protein
MNIQFLRTGLAAMALSFLLGTTPALAHHSFDMFDMSKQITLTGTIKEFQWTNPHTFT